jgi:hypothetical protein
MTHSTTPRDQLISSAIVAYLMTSAQPWQAPNAVHAYVVSQIPDAACREVDDALEQLDVDGTVNQAEKGVCLVTAFPDLNPDAWIPEPPPAPRPATSYHIQLVGDIARNGRTTRVSNITLDIATSFDDAVACSGELSAMLHHATGPDCNEFPANDDGTRDRYAILRDQLPAARSRWPDVVFDIRMSA